MSKRSKKKRELFGSRMQLQNAVAEAGSPEHAKEIVAAKKQVEQIEAKMFLKTGNVEYLTTLPAWKKAKIARDQACIERLSKNGITPKDLEDEYKRGYDAARHDLTRMTMQFFYSAIAIATHRIFKFGETRIYRLLDAVQQIMCEEITTADIRERCKDETGVDIILNEYDN